MMPSFMLVLSLLNLVSFSLALPKSFLPTLPKVKSLNKRAVSTEQLATFNLYEQYSAAAYCPDNNESSGTKLTCADEICPEVEAADTYTVLEFQNSLVTDVTGFVATDSTNELIVLAFRGSESIRNWVTDVDTIQVQTDICDDCYAHEGFWDSWVEARDGVLSAAMNASNANPNYHIISTGHSLGAAIASLAVAELRNRNYTAALYNFGSPRIGGDAISFYIGNQTGGNYRLTHLDDPVPRLPPADVGFAHIMPEYHITSGNYVSVSTEDIDVLSGENNPNGDYGGTTTDFDAHSWYFSNISACASNISIEFRKDRRDAAKYQRSWNLL